MANNDHDGYTVGAASSHQDRCTIGIINNYAPGNGTSAALVAFVGRVSSAPQRLSWPCRLRIAGVKLAARQMCAQAPGGNNRARRTRAECQLSLTVPLPIYNIHIDDNPATEFVLYSAYIVCEACIRV